MKFPRIQYQAFTLKSDALLNELKTNVFVSSKRAVDQISPDLQDFSEFTAIWDTGATSTVCSPNVIDAIGLNRKHIDTVPVIGVNSQTESNLYLIHQLLLPNKVICVDIPMIVGDIGGDVDLLIGMDIITQGDFAITHHGNQTLFSFCIPPHYNKIDFVERSKAIMRRK